MSEVLGQKLPRYCAEEAGFGRLPKPYHWADQMNFWDVPDTLDKAINHRVCTTQPLLEDVVIQWETLPSERSPTTSS